MPKTKVRVGPLDHGRPMSLEEFDLAEVQPGYLYELSRGVITVTDVPGTLHFALLTAVRRQLAAYDLAHPGAIYGIGGGPSAKSSCPILSPSDTPTSPFIEHDRRRRTRAGP